MQVTLAYAERQLRHWTKKVDELRLTRQTRLTSNTKENEKEQENIPPTPPIREKEKEKEKNTHKRACAREICDSSFFASPTLNEILAYWDTCNYRSDAGKFFKFYTARGWKIEKTEIADWKAAADMWEERYIEKHPIEISKPKAQPKVWTITDWALCSERCAKFAGGKCTCGITTPPDRDPSRPHPPDECPHFTKTKNQ